MKFLIQRVKSASIAVEGEKVSEIGKGLLVFLALEKGDGEHLFAKAIDKLTGLRLFADENGKMNLSVADSEGDVLLVSQFTLAGDVRKGKRPSYDRAMPVEDARAMYHAFALAFKDAYPRVQEGVFQAMMDVSLVNDGPVTIWYECP